MTVDRVIDILQRKSTTPEEGETSEEISQAFDIAISLIKESTSVIHCADCDEWSHSREHIFRDGDEGYCCVHHCITGKNYYCGDAEEYGEKLMKRTNSNDYFIAYNFMKGNGSGAGYVVIHQDKYEPLTYECIGREMQKIKRNQGFDEITLVNFGRFEA